MHLPLARPALLLLVAVACAACGGEDGQATGAPTGTGSAPDSSVDHGSGDPELQVAAELEVTLRGIGDKSSGIGIPSRARCSKSIPARCTAAISCPPNDDLPDQQRLCTWLASTGHAALLAAPPEREVCTQVYGGPETARVTGTFGDTDVDAEFSRQNGCAIARWHLVAPLWDGPIPEPGDAVPGGAAPEGAEGNSDPGVVPRPEEANVPEREPEVISDPPEAFE